MELAFQGWNMLECSKISKVERFQGWRFPGRQGWSVEFGRVPRFELLGGRFKIWSGIVDEQITMGREG